MKLLVFAHTPPPMHGQSAMVAAMLDGLRGDPAFEVLHVNARFSRDSTDVGRWRIGKLGTLVFACAKAITIRLRRGSSTFYYVPAPGKRVALYRDLIVMLLCRPWFEQLVLHWHAVGLGQWLNDHAHPIERALAGWLLGGADLALVLAPELAADAQCFAPRRIAVVPNGIPDPAPAAVCLRPATRTPCRVLFLGLCSRAKGLFDTVDAVAMADSARPGGFELTVAGGFETPVEQDEFQRRVSILRPNLVRYMGFADEPVKHALFANSDVFCFPTSYPHEGQPLALIEALAHDVPIITTRWRAIAGMLPCEHVWFVSPGTPDELARTLQEAARVPPPAGALRRHYLAHFTPEQHLSALTSALLSVAPENPRDALA